MTAIPNIATNYTKLKWRNYGAAKFLQLYAGSDRSNIVNRMAPLPRYDGHTGGSAPIRRSCICSASWCKHRVLPGCRGGGLPPRVAAQMLRREVHRRWSTLQPALWRRTARLGIRERTRIAGRARTSGLGGIAEGLAHASRLGTGENRPVHADVF